MNKKFLVLENTSKKSGWHYVRTSYGKGMLKNNFFVRIENDGVHDYYRLYYFAKRVTMEYILYDIKKINEVVKLYEKINQFIERSCNYDKI